MENLEKIKRLLKEASRKLKELLEDLQGGDLAASGFADHRAEKLKKPSKEYLDFVKRKDKLKKVAKAYIRENLRKNSEDCNG